MKTHADKIMAVCRKYSKKTLAIHFPEPVARVYAPLEYAREPLADYLRRYAGAGQYLFLGMNPGPFGMAQTGVPFGEVNAVRDWLRIRGKVGKPDDEHPKRPVQGFACTRSEVSGRRLWGLFQEMYPEPGDFFRKHFVWNYCPLVFMEEGGRNITPDKLNKEARRELFALCDAFLQEVAELLQPAGYIGIGRFARLRLEKLFAEKTEPVLEVLHPSPASPKANRGWARQAREGLIAAGVWEN